MTEEKPKATPEEAEQWIMHEAANLSRCLAITEERYGPHVARGILLAVASAGALPPGQEEHMDAKLAASAVCMRMGWRNPYPEVVPPVVIGPPAEA